MNCPICNVLLLMTERQGTQIDYCPQCRGIWLEKGALDRIIERSGAQAAPQAISRNQESHSPRRDDGHHDKHHDDHYDGHRKKRSFLQDLFD
ncbi:MAG: zf-TFIIB domain-containing protein [Deltaproteobacteria bacterium]|nr:zf-TFIIB domain-containing protein [Deltaproteobacteria bacterium]